MGFVDAYSWGNWGYGMYDRGEGLQKDDRHVGWAMAGYGNDAVGFVQPIGEGIAKALGNARAAEAMATPIIQAGLFAMMAMSNTCGFGDPNTGDQFSQGAAKFGDVKNKLESAVRPASWDGDAANAYDARNREHSARVDRLKEADEAIKNAIKSEAEQNDVTRKMLDRCQTVLGLAIIPAIALNAVPGWGQAASLVFQTAAVAGALPPAEWRYLDLIDNSARNATLIRRAGATYDEVAAQAGDWPGACR